MRRFYKNEEEFATVNDRIRRGDIVGAKGQPSKYILHNFLFFYINFFYLSSNKKR
jgi:hypothetical protein